MREGETVGVIMKRLGLKHFRCYLLAKNSNKDDDEDLPRLSHKQKCPGKSSDPIRINTGVGHDKIKEIPVTSELQTSRPENHTNLLVDHEEEIFTTLQSEPEIVDFLPYLDDIEPSTSGTQKQDVVMNVLAVAAEESGIIQFGSLPSNEDDLDATLPIVKYITVHRGLVCRDLLMFFSEGPHEYSKFEIKMLKQDGTEEIADDNGGVMRDVLTEFWETFYTQYTEGNSYKVPVIRHDITESLWRAVADVIKIGYTQEGVFPIKLAPSFMQQAIFGQCNNNEVIDSFLKFVPMMDKVVFEAALKDFPSVGDDIMDVLEQYDVKTLESESNIREIAHKELIQKPMFVADAFYKVLKNTKLVEAEMEVMYSALQPTPKKVLKALIFPNDMRQDEISSFVKKMVREMDDPQSLKLFLRFCTGSDMMTKPSIHIRFTSVDVSASVRCPSAHTCGCVLEVPKSYAQDPFVTLKADFMEILKNRYRQMDIV
ncbi:uncharacterized protein [Argopecten irradians]|uniref:uncharacterized protein n=1 Tax=Argopecten irradians TaxID=31199 RepID=UPI0037107151